MSTATTQSPVHVAHFSNDCLEKTTAHSGMSLSDNSCDVDYGLPSDVAERLVKRTETRVAQVLAQSIFVQQHCTLYDLPRFEREDLELGEMIAYGGFSNVYEILNFNNGSGSALSSQPTITPEGTKAKRRYIVKNLNPKLAFNPKKLVVGAKDLVMEAHFLSSFNHPNIIQLRGWSAAGIAGFSEAGRADGFFLIFDRLAETQNHCIGGNKPRKPARIVANDQEP